MSMVAKGRGSVVQGVWSHRFLTFTLIRRQYQLRYRQSMVGLVWAILPSLVTVLAATLVFHKVARIDTGDIPYPIFTFAALVPWTFFSSSLTSGRSAVICAARRVLDVPIAGRGGSSDSVRFERETSTSPGSARSRTAGPR